MLSPRPSTALSECCPLPKGALTKLGAVNPEGTQVVAFIVVSLESLMQHELQVHRFSFRK